MGPPRTETGTRCPICGTVYETGISYCGRCGSRLDVEVAPPQALEPVSLEPASGVARRRSVLPVVIVALALSVALWLMLRHPGAGGSPFVDLSRQANQPLTAPMHGAAGNTLDGLRPGSLRSPTTEYRLGQGIVHLAGMQTAGLPQAAMGLPVQGAVARMHVLHACGYGGGNGPSAMDGAEIARFVVHYQDGSSMPVPIRYGREVADWYAYPYEQLIASGSGRPSIAWTGRNEAAERFQATIRLFEMTWENPYPRKAVASLDYVSQGSSCDPFLLAITLDRS